MKRIFSILTLTLLFATPVLADWKDDLEDAGDNLGDAAKDLGEDVGDNLEDAANNVNEELVHDDDAEDFLTSPLGLAVIAGAVLVGALGAFLAMKRKN